ncbi:MAG: iron-containing alcohol dehydrogenase, partial [Ruminiclostridium sp.]|nr:iron-containing alcohol dehydrogenase [Ruminiclostridium sp.]
GKNDSEKLDNLIEGLEKLKARVGIKKTIRDYGVSEEDFLATLDEMSEAAFDDQCTGANPRYPLISELKQLYMNAFYGGTFKDVEMPGAASPEKAAAKRTAKSRSAAQSTAVSAGTRKRTVKKAAEEDPAPKKRGRKPAKK